MKQKFYRFFAMLIMLSMVVFNCPVTATGAAAEAPVIEIKITHDPVENAIAGQRIMLEVEVEDESGADVVRAYFKALEALEYNFVVLEAFKEETYKGTLPAPANGVGEIDYLILVKNGNNQVVKTQTYRIKVADGDNTAQSVAKKEQIDVYTELEQAPAEVTGFTDNIAIDVVDSAAKFGVVAGIYGSAAGSSTSTAVSAGTVAASTGGVSTTSIVIGSVAALAAVGGIAAAAGGGSGGGTSSESSTATCQYSGSWRGQFNEISCDGLSYSGNWTGTVDSGCVFSGFDSSGGFLRGTINSSTGNAQLTGLDADCGALNGSAVFNGSNVNGLYSGSGVSGSFSGVR